MVEGSDLSVAGIDILRVEMTVDLELQVDARTEEVAPDKLVLSFVLKELGGIDLIEIGRARRCNVVDLVGNNDQFIDCLLYTSPSPRD